MIYFYYFVLHGNEKDLSDVCVVGDTVWFKTIVKNMNSYLFNLLKVLHENTASFFLGG